MTTSSGSNNNDQLRHMLKTIQCRMNGVIDRVSPGFGDFSIGDNTRKPVEILSHVADVLAFCIEQVTPGSFQLEPGPGDWSDQARRYQAALFGLDQAFSQQEVSEDLAQRALQGPIADVLTHVGQLAMLRGLANDPVPGQMFFGLDLTDVVQDRD